MNDLAEVAPNWVCALAAPEWFKRYGQRFDNLRLPRGQEEREKLMETIGRDGFTVLNAVLEAPTHEQLHALVSVEILRRIWVQQYWIEHHADDGCRFTCARTRINLQARNGSNPLTI